MCETSNSPHRSRTALCSAMMPVRVLHGHLVAGEGDDLGAERVVDFVERRALEGVGGGLGHFLVLRGVRRDSEYAPLARAHSRVTGIAM